MHAVARRLASSVRRGAASAPPASSPNASVITHSRRMHVRRKLPYNVEDGMGSFLPQQGLQTIAVEYQQGLLDRLNDEIKGTELVNKPVAQIVLDTALEPTKGLTFNYASEALNNDFFLHCITPPMHGKPDHEDALIASTLHQAIVSQYGTLDKFKSAVAGAAMGMFSSGWVWCVTDTTGNIGVLATYGAGTILVSNRTQRFEESLSYDLGGKYVVGSTVDAADSHNFAGGSDARSPNPQAPLTGAPASSPTSGKTTNLPPFKPSTSSRALHSSARSAIGRGGMPSPQNHPGTAQLLSESSGERSTSTDYERLGEVLVPLFCVSVHEHAWMSAGYGIWGKERYLRNFWSVVNWEHAAKTFEANAPDTFGRAFRVPNAGW